jgi:hypothetical protein
MIVKTLLILPPAPNGLREAILLAVSTLLVFALIEMQNM